jgi:hypothetical protein
MADTYYSRLTIVNPQDINTLDPRLGVVVAETATTGRFIMGEINWDNLVSPNFQTSVAYNGYGDLKIFEPMGFTFFDYIRAAAYEVGCENHLDARFFLEIEILAENFINKAGTSIDSPFKYIWPIMLVSTDVKSSVSEKGSEYVLKFIHSNHHSQTDLVQPIKDTTKIKAANIKDFFDKLSIELENKEYKYAEARQKAGSPNNGGGAHPAEADPYHDEYHFLVQPQIENFTFTSKGKADPAIKESFGSSWFGGKQKWDVTARPGTTIISWINRVLMSTQEVSDLLPGRGQAQKPGASGSSEANKKVIEDNMGKPYQFFRIETYTVYKDFDYIRGRYAVKHIFLIFLADQPNMYQYPDELDLLNKQSNKDKILSKLKYYVQEGLLRKVYYHNYTGLNSDIIKVDLQFNQSYSLPSFPVIWTDRGQTGPGQMNKQNYRKEVTPYVQNDTHGVERKELTELRRGAKIAASQIQKLKKSDDEQKKRLQNYIDETEKIIAEKEQLLRAKQQTEKSQNAIKNRSDLLATLKSKYSEDVDFKKIYNDILSVNYSSLRPRVEPDVIGEDIDIAKAENEKLMEKIFSVLLAPRDLIDMELEILADPYWLGMPNVMLLGKNQLEKVEFSTSNEQEIKKLIDETMPNLDPDWNTRINAWGDYGQAQFYKGANLFYFNSQAPTIDWGDNDTMAFNTTDQILGIYQVWSVTNSFKEGKWTQRLKARKDITIPSYVLPRGVVGETTFEQFMEAAINDTEREADKVNEIRQQSVRERTGAAQLDNLSGTNGAGAAGIRRGDTNNSSAPVLSALNSYREKLKNNPPPEVNDPVAVAQALTETPPQVTKDMAYAQAKEQYIAQTRAHFEHTNKLSQEAYAENGITNYKPYPAEALAAEAIQKSGSGGLEDWKRNNTERPGPAAINNPSGLGFDAKTGTYNKYDTFNDGMKATTEYYNYGIGVPPNGRQGQDRLLLPNDWTGSPSDYISKKSKKGNI